MLPQERMFEGQMLGENQKGTEEGAVMLQGQCDDGGSPTDLTPAFSVFGRLALHPWDTAGKATNVNKL